MQLDLLSALTDPDVIEWRPVGLELANTLIAREHYLGPISGGRLILGGMLGPELVAVQVWRHPTSRRLPKDGSWLELSRWCLTPEAGEYAGSRQHRAAVRHMRLAMPEVTTLVSYSDPSAGHTGALYRSCNWLWAPTWLRLRPPPTAQGRWAAHRPTEAVKDRWVFPLRKDPVRADVLAVEDLDLPRPRHDQHQGGLMEIRFGADDQAHTEAGTYSLDRDHTRGEGVFYTLYFTPRGGRTIRLGAGRPQATSRQEGTLREMRRLAAWYEERLSARDLA